MGPSAALKHHVRIWPSNGQTLQRALPILLLITWFAGACLLTLRGAFVNADYEKIFLNRPSILQPPLNRFFQRDAGFEPGYYRPVANVTLSYVAHAFGVEHAAPFRVVATVVLGLATLAVYGVARSCACSSTASFAAAAFFAIHPCNNWYYFQATWLGNTLSMAAMACVWIAFRRLELSTARWRSLWLLVLVLGAFVACLCKDSGALLVPMLLPLALWAPPHLRRRRWGGIAVIATGAGLFFLLRQLVLGDETRLFTSGESIRYAWAHAADIILQYGSVLMTGTNRNYARLLQAGYGWPLTLLLVLGIGALLWTQRRSKAAMLLWCIAVAATEMVVGAAFQYEMVPTRVTLLIALIALCGAVCLGPAVTSRGRRWVLPFILGWFVWLGIQTMVHVGASLDQDRFYAYHNTRPYSWKLLLSWALVCYQRGDFEAAVQAARTSLALRPRHDVRFVLALYLEKLGAYEEAAAHYDMLVRLVPNDPRIERHFGTVLLRQGRMGEAIVHLTRALALNPNYAEAHESLAEALTRQGRSEEARQHVEAAQRADAVHEHLRYIE